MRFVAESVPMLSGVSSWRAEQKESRMEFTRLSGATKLRRISSPARTFVRRLVDEEVHTVDFTFRIRERATLEIPRRKGGGR